MTSPDLATLVTDFFVRHLASERNVSPHTAAAYRDALKLLLRFARDVAHRSVAGQIEIAAELFRVVGLLEAFRITPDRADH